MDQQKIYKCLSSDFPTLTKKINRITKKLDSKNIPYTFHIIGEQPEKISVYDFAGKEYVPASQFIPKKSYTIANVTSYTFDMEPLKIGQYEVLAVIEHNATIEGKNANMIHVIKENIAIPEKYRTIASHCEHCNIERQRNKTVLLQSQIGDIIQVGTTCLHEYTGIECLDVIGYYQDVHDIYINEPYIDKSELSRYDGIYEQTVNFLASSIKFITEKGYDKETTKYKAWENIRNDNYTNYIDVAETVINHFANHDFTDNFLWNIKSALTQEYTKCNGFIAYAYIAYQKEQQKEQQKQVEKISEYYGNVGDKIQLELTFNNRFSFETNYTYHGETNYIYIFADVNGNVFKWKTTKCIFKNPTEYIHFEEGDKLTLKGTIKKHEEYNGQKQTELTRCKVV